MYTYGAWVCLIDSLIDILQDTLVEYREKYMHGLHKDYLF